MVPRPARAADHLRHLRDEPRLRLGPGGPLVLRPGDLLRHRRLRAWRWSPRAWCRACPTLSALGLLARRAGAGARSPTCSASSCSAGVASRAPTSRSSRSSAAVIAERLASHWRFIGGFNGLLGVPPLRLGGFELFLPLPTYYVMLAARGAGLARALLARARPVRHGAARDPRPRGAHRLLRLRRRRLQAARLHLSGAVAGLAGGLFA